MKAVTEDNLSHLQVIQVQLGYALGIILIYHPIFLSFLLGPLTKFYDILLCY
jgi:hypothetical protein